MLSFLVDSETCRHVLLERFLGAGLQAASQLCCQQGHPACDNCTRAAQVSVTTSLQVVQQKDWLPALLHLVRELEGKLPSGGSLSLRGLASAWLRSPTAPAPTWVRSPLLLYAILYRVLYLSFVPITVTGDGVLEPKERIIRWSAHVSVDSRGRYTAAQSAELQTIRLHASMWGPLMSGELDPAPHETLAAEVEQGAEDQSDLASESERDTDSDTESDNS